MRKSARKLIFSGGTGIFPDMDKFAVHVLPMTGLFSVHFRLRDQKKQAILLISGRFPETRRHGPFPDLHMEQADAPCSRRIISVSFFS